MTTTWNVYVVSLPIPRNEMKNAPIPIESCSFLDPDPLLSLGVDYGRKERTKGRMGRKKIKMKLKFRGPFLESPENFLRPKLRPAYSVKLVFLNVVKEIKIHTSWAQVIHVDSVTFNFAFLLLLLLLLFFPGDFTRSS